MHVPKRVSCLCQKEPAVVEHLPYDGCTSVNRIWVHLSRRESRWLFGIQYCALPAFPRSRCEKVNSICLCRKGSPACAGKGHLPVPERIICMCRKGSHGCAGRGHMHLPERVTCMCWKGSPVCAKKSRQSWSTCHMGIAHRCSGDSRDHPAVHIVLIQLFEV